ncbi:MAG: hypothetical protein Kow0068_05000 [Marinilabiliales bacterium]
MKRILSYSLLVSFAIVILFSACEKVEDPTPTHELMQGVWKLETAYDENDSNITSDVTSFFPNYLHMDDKNSVNSTCGPLFMYIVYGKSKFINIVSRLDEVFSYADLSLTEGEWFINKNEVVDKFTIEIKLKFPGFDTFTEIMSYMDIDVGGIVGDMLDAVVYHKFMDVSVDISDENPDVMTWAITDATIAAYNTKDQYGNYVSFTGIGTDSFTRCTINWSKQVKTINQCIEDYNASQTTK